MSYEVELSPTFKKEAKRLGKKYTSLKNDLAVLIAQLEEYPKQGTPMDNNVYKIRIAIASKGKGKSGGARAISLVMVSNNIVILLTIYNKGDKNNISDKEIKELLKGYL